MNFDKKASGYNSVKSEFIYDYIKEYTEAIYKMVEPTNNNKQRAFFASKDRTRLKRIAAKLEGVKAELEYITNKTY